MWPWLADRYGTITALDAPHATHPEQFSFGELAQRIATAAAAFEAKGVRENDVVALFSDCLLYTSPSPRDQRGSRMPSSA